MQKLVYDNYNKFITATETIRVMKADVYGMDPDMEAVRCELVPCVPSAFSLLQLRVRVTNISLASRGAFVTLRCGGVHQQRWCHQK
jgi:hypothetical protein